MVMPRSTDLHMSYTVRAAAETATHDVRCKICRVYPIVGFRYHCRRCFNLDICHACFFLGKTVKGHKPEHPMQVKKILSLFFLCVINFYLL